MTIGRFAITLIALVVGGGAVALTQLAPAPAAVPTLTPSSTTPTPLHPHEPAPLAGFVLSPSLAGGPDLVAEFSVADGLRKSWGTGALPGQYGTDKGAFRFTCGGEGKLSYDDPLLYPGQPGKSHLHKVWGSVEFDAFTTVESLAKTRDSNCNYGPNTLNRSAYWMPALIDDQGNVRNPDLVAVYYKRAKASSPLCDANQPRAIGKCVNLPNDIRFIFGWDPTKPDAPARGMTWYCTAGTKQHYTNLDDLFASGCAEGATMVADLSAPDCWDGKHLDTPDHRSHMARGGYGSWGYYRCPASHPYVIPRTENKVMWTVASDMIGTRSDGTKFSRVRLSSDELKPGAKPGETMHADYIEQWLKAAKDMWHDNCIDKGLDCSGGDLGNGLQLIGASQPRYGWKNPKPRSAIPLQ